MSRFKSAIGLKSGELLHAETDDYEDLIEYFNILPDFVRLEYTSDDLTDLKSYKLKIDENEIPDWVTDDTLEKWERKLHRIVKNSFVTEDKKILVGGRYILSGEITIGKLVNCIIINAGNATIINAGNAIIIDASHSNIQDAGNSIIHRAWWCSNIKNAGNSIIIDAGHSIIKNAGYSIIIDAGHSIIEDAGCSTIINKQV